MLVDVKSGAVVYNSRTEKKNMASKNKTCFGVSFGNTNLCIAVHKDGKADVVANDSGERTTPAVVNFSQHEICVGLHAKNRLLRQPRSTIAGVKHMIGSNNIDLWQNPNIEVSQNGKTLEYTVNYEDDDGNEIEKKYTTEKLAELQLNKLHEIAANQRSDSVYPSVLCAPCNFSSEQRQILVDCAGAAGFHVLRVINEPTAAAMAYFAKTEPSPEAKNILVYRLGGESSDVSVIKHLNAMYQMVVSDHNNEIGGKLWTNELAKYAAEEFRRKTKVSWEDINKRSKGKVLAAAEVAKHVLSTMEGCACSAESVYEGVDMNVQLSRARFDMACQGLLTKCREHLESVLQGAGFKTDDIHHVILTGGGCKMTQVQKMVKEVFKKAEIHSRIPPDEVHAIGASYEADLLLSRKVELDEKHLQKSIKLPALSKSICIKVKDGTLEPILAAGSAIPCRYESPIICQEDEMSVSVGLYQEDTPLAEIVMRELTDKSDLKLLVEVNEDRSLRCECLDKSTKKSQSILVK